MANLEIPPRIQAKFHTVKSTLMIVSLQSIQTLVLTMIYSDNVIHLVDDTGNSPIGITIAIYIVCKSSMFTEHSTCRTNRNVIFIIEYVSGSSVRTLVS